MFLKILTFLLTSVAIYLALSTVLIVIGTPKKRIPPEKSLAFKELRFDYSRFPKIQQFQARDGTPLSYRHYASQSNQVVILLHGSGWHSQYFLPLAGFLSSQGLAQVYTPNLRGHGRTPVRRGDIDYIDSTRATRLATIQMISPPSRNHYWLLPVLQTMPSLLNNLNP